MAGVEDRRRSVDSGLTSGFLHGASVLLLSLTSLAVLGLVEGSTGRAALLVSVAVGLYLVGLLGGWTVVVLMSGVPMLGAVVWDVLSTTEQALSRSLVIGCLWFCTGELGTLAIQWRRLNRHRVSRGGLPRGGLSGDEAGLDDGSYSPISEPADHGLIRDRLMEMAVVVGVTSALVVIGGLATVVSIPRTVTAQVVGLAVVVVAVLLARRRLTVSARR